MSNLINENIVKGKWKEIKADVQKAWGNITGDEIEGTKGDLTKIAGIVQRKYGMAQEEVRDKLNEMIARYRSDVKERQSEEVKRPDIDESLREEYRPV